MTPLSSPLRLLLALALVCSVAGCAGSERLADPPEARRARDYAATPDALRAATGAYFEAEGFASVGEMIWERPATSFAATLFGPARERVTATVAPSETGARLVLLLRYTREDGAEVAINPELAATEYDRHLNGLAARLAAGG